MSGRRIVGCSKSKVWASCLGLSFGSLLAACTSQFDEGMASAEKGGLAPRCDSTLAQPSLWVCVLALEGYAWVIGGQVVGSPLSGSQFYVVSEVGGGPHDSNEYKKTVFAGIGVGAEKDDAHYSAYAAYAYTWSIDPVGLHGDNRRKPLLSDDYRRMPAECEQVQSADAIWGFAARILAAKGVRLQQPGNAFPAGN